LPNHCENDLRVTGPKDELKRFKKFAKGINPWAEDRKEELLSCHKIIPAPKEAIKDYGKVGYRWCIDNWGTKWGCYETDLQEQDRELFYAFQSAWSPPLPVIKKMGEMFPKLNFDLRYFEAGMGFNGMYRIEKGKVVSDESGNYFGNRGG
jgi:hypothetical protein